MFAFVREDPAERVLVVVSFNALTTTSAGVGGTLFVKQPAPPYMYVWPVFDGKNQPTPFDGVYRTSGGTYASPSSGPTRKCD